MQYQNKPTSPWSNPPLNEGIYDAVIDELRHTTYGETDDPMVQIVFRIPSETVYLVTNVYFPVGGSIGSQRRLYYLSACVGLELTDVYEDPQYFTDRCLRIHVQRQGNGQGGTHTDVTAFLPAVDGWEQVVSESAVESKNHPDWITPLGEPA